MDGGTVELQRCYFSSTVARIQFRLPDGRAQTRHFDPDDALSKLYDFVGQDLNVGFADFSLSTTFPSRQLDREDRAKTLRSLELVPTATVLVLPAGKGGAGAAGSGGGGPLANVGSLQGFIALLLYPITLIWGFIQGFLNGGGGNAGGAGGGVDQRR